MPSRSVIALLIGIAAVFIGIASFTVIDIGSDAGTVEYYDGDMLLECREIPADHRVSVSGYDGSHRIVSYTFFGWNTSPDGSGITYIPGSEMDSAGSVRLYAMVTDGNMSVNGGIADFSMSDIPDDGKPLFIDIGIAGDPDSVRISPDTVRGLGSACKPVSVVFGHGCRMNLDADAVSGCSSLVGDSGSPLVLGMPVRGGGSVRAVMMVGDVGVTSLPAGKASFDIGYEPSCPGSEIKVLENGTGDVGATVSDGMISFSTGNLSEFRIMELMRLTVIRDSDGSRVDPGSDADMELSATGTYERWGMFAEGDTFTVSSRSRTMHFDVTGADRSDDGVYTVTGGSNVTMIVKAGTAVYDIILPAEQKGYTLKADPKSVKEGGGCVITYTSTAGYDDSKLMIKVNGTAVEMDSMKRIYLSGVKNDKVVTVEGVYDKRTYIVGVPEEQTGYTLSVSEQRVHHGQSYDVVLKIEPGYVRGPDFRVLVNGSLELDMASGSARVDDVQAGQTVTVSGVVAEEYSISAGSNTVLTVNGMAASTATVNDVISVSACAGYTIPGTYASCIGEGISAVKGGYRVTGDAVFPSVVRLTVGDNVTAGGCREGGSLCVCTSDPVTVSAESGYSLPADYPSALLSKTGVKGSSGGFVFSADTEIPSIYKITYKGFSSIHEEFFVSANAVIPIPYSNPSECAYEFRGWETDKTIASGDLIINSIWNPCTFKISFGCNLIVKIGNLVYSFDKIENRTISIRSDEKIEISTTSGASLPAGYGPSNRNGILCGSSLYKVVGDCSFPGISYVYYINPLNPNLEYTDVAIIGQSYKPTLKSDWEVAGYRFMGWKLDGVYLDNQIDVILENYILVAQWEKTIG